MGKTVLCLGAFELHTNVRGFHKELKNVPVWRQANHFFSERVAVTVKSQAQEKIYIGRGLSKIYYNI